VCAYLAAVLLWTVFSSGCQTGDGPRMRGGAFFGSPLGMTFSDPARLGKHSRSFSLSEVNGMAYTCRGGFIDIAHMREAADRTAYLAAVTYRNLMLGKTEFSFVVIEPSQYQVTISYPEDWNDRSAEDRASTAKEVSLRLGQHFAHTSMIWHEIITWYGFASSGIFPENISSFSWEDTYSDLAGTCLAVQALRDDKRGFDEAMTILIDRTLRDLDVQSAEFARRAAKRVEGEWFAGSMYLFVTMKMRNFEVGMDNGQITPLLVPGMCSDAEPQAWPVPSMDIVSQQGFAVEVQMEPRIWQQSRIYHDIGLQDTQSRIRPDVHFPEIMAHIKSEAWHGKALSDSSQPVTDGTLREVH
jgi:hypothetical protein